MSMYSRSHESGALIGIILSYSLPSVVCLELSQEPQVVPVEEPEVVDAVAEHGDALRPHAEGEAAVLVGVYAAVHEHLRVDHPRAHDLQPACVLARPAARPAAPDAVYRQVHAR